MLEGSHLGVPARGRHACILGCAGLWGAGNAQQGSGGPARLAPLPPGTSQAPDLAVCGAENRCRIESRSPKCGGSKAKNELCCPRAAGNRKSWPLLPGGRGGVGGADQDGTWAPRTGPLDGCDASRPLTRAATRLLSAGHGNRPGLRSEATWVLEGRGGGSLDLQDGQVNVPRPHRRKIMPTNFKRRCADRKSVV